MIRFVRLAFALPLLLACQASPTRTITGDDHRIAMANARIDLGIGYMELSQYSKALQNFQRAKQHAEHHYRVYLSLGKLHSLMQHDKQAEQFYQQALQLAPDNDDALFHFALHVCYHDSYAKALPWFQATREHAHFIQLSEVFYARGVCANTHQLPQQAKQDFETALRYQPNHIDAVYHLALLELSSHQYQQAEQRLMVFHHRFGEHERTKNLLQRIHQRAVSQERVLVPSLDADRDP
ncbi:tetratricopeptide repeat protein [Vibrio hippocampi]|uniref:Type IV pilus biogenesis/stability protein PilW n=1 Tax=Vibrio hippocampi TaxID=654686 RepID=A0ABM8ZH09_9VIBR|nr:hypothetical protein [Vibrio hippocampi]CAH0525647.1 hypothetical protein VHP8226_01175 [Vibrio hippocampi]